jgi:hypothetical protein
MRTCRASAIPSVPVAARFVPASRRTVAGSDVLPLGAANGNAHVSPAVLPSSPAVAANSSASTSRWVGQRQSPPQIAQIVGQQAQRQPHLVATETVTGEAGHLHRLLAFLDPLFRCPALVVEAYRSGMEWKKLLVIPKLLILWSGRRDSNPRRPAWEDEFQLTTKNMAFLLASFWL